MKRLPTQLKLVLERRCIKRQKPEDCIKGLKVGLTSKVDALLVVLLPKAVMKEF